MKSSLFLMATAAMLASAVPLDKRAIVTHWVTDVVTVTVTDNGPTSTLPPAVFVENKKAKPTPTTTTTPPPPPPPASLKVQPQTSSTPPPPPPPPAPKPTTLVPAPKPKITTVVAPPPPQETPAPSPPASGLGEYESTMVEQHNIYRAKHSAAGLEWDATLAQYAANTANTCVFEHDMSQGGGGYGQNLASSGSSGNIDSLQLQTASDAVSKQWYGEVKNYGSFYGMDNPPSNVPLGDYGHFTQLVWKATTKVGCATVKCAAGTVLSLDSWYTVCNYKSPGNFGGEYGKNVGAPVS